MNMQSLACAAMFGTLAFCAGCGVAAGDPAAKAKAPDTAQGVRVEVVKPQPRVSVQPAQIEPLEQVDIIAKVTGYLDHYEKDAEGKEIDTGSRVKAGQTLAILSVPEMVSELKLKESKAKEAESAVLAAQEHVTQTEKDREKYRADQAFCKSELDRHEKLFKDNSIPESLLDSKRSQCQSATAAVASADAKLSATKADLEVAKARVDVAKHDAARTAELLKYATLVAPAAGKNALYVVTRRWADPGAFLQPNGGSPKHALLSLARIDRVRVVVDLPEIEAARVQSGDRAVVQVAALPGQKFDGKVTRFASALDPSTRTMRVEIELANKEGRPFWPGMYANVTLYLDDAKGILTLPSKLVHKDGTQVFVWAAADGKARKLPVTVAADDGTTAEIKGGLRPDTVVVRPVQGTLKADQPVILPDKPTK